ncbi:MAG: cytochrome c [Gammaproteobacteria bacterium]|nr:cytochrome c [Gammaproteobacteria bacterium]
MNTLTCRLLSPLLSLVAAAALAAEAPPTPDTAYLPAADGAALYVEYCAVCHGSEGRGDGPLAGGLTVKPANLRRLGVSNGSEFPTARIAASIDGRDQPLAHGTREMPIWGEAFKRSQGAYGERRVAERIDALVDYLRRLQER